MQQENNFRLPIYVKPINGSFHCKDEFLFLKIILELKGVCDSYCTRTTKKTENYDYLQLTLSEMSIDLAYKLFQSHALYSKFVTLSVQICP